MTSPETKRFGRYEILGELGRGAMGVVYKARDPQIERVVAVKTISLLGHEPEMMEEYRLRFMNEAQAAGRLHHPGIVAVFDVGEDTENHDPYIVLEYVAGEALNRILAREKKLPLERALQLATEVADALEYAHAQGVTHRDIKPGNILITQDGHAKIADFGIAKLNLAHFTLPGKVLGTPAFMAPEQLAGKSSDGRSDLFSLGVILYTMVTGHSPFQGNSATTVCFQVAHREPMMPSVLDLNLPREIDAVIRTAMAKDPEDRYQRGAELAADLRQLQTLTKSGAGTTTSLQAITGMTTAQTTRRSALNQPGELSDAVNVFRRLFAKSLARDLILGIATVVLLVVIGIQSRLLSHGGQKTSEVAQTPQTEVQPAISSRAVTELAPAQGARASSSAKKEDQEPGAKSSASALKAASAHPSRKAHAEPKTVVVSLSMVELAVRHQFKEATLSVWVDDQLALTRSLHGGAQKRLVVFGGVHGAESETLKVPSGQHILRFRAQTGDQSVDLSKTISANLIGGDDKTLLITFDKHNTEMHLEWQ